MNEQNVAVLGGSFDPPHLGHLMAVGKLLLSSEIDKILIIPCFQQTGKSLSNFELRYQMCQETFGFLPKVSVCDIEKTLGGESFTVRTLKYLAANNYNWKLRWVIGSDLTEKIKTWEGYEDIEKIGPPLVINRFAISSTQIKSSIGSAERYLTRKVFEIVKENKLYG